MSAPASDIVVDSLLALVRGLLPEPARSIVEVALVAARELLGWGDPMSAVEALAKVAPTATVIRAREAARERINRAVAAGG